MSARLERVAATRLAVVVDDRDAAYPVRIDPTFSDANWVSLGVVPGVNNSVSAAVVDGAGKLYVGGGFSTAGGVSASRIAQWDGSSWSALDSGLDNWVYALAESGGVLYAGGAFTTPKFDTFGPWRDFPPRFLRIAENTQPTENQRVAHHDGVLLPAAA